MNLKKYAETKGITLDEAKEETGLTHWNQKVVEEAPAVAPAPKQDDRRIHALRSEAIRLRRYLGENSEKYLRHVSCYRDLIPDEYDRAKENIGLYL